MDDVFNLRRHLCTTSLYAIIFWIHYTFTSNFLSARNSSLKSLENVLWSNLSAPYCHFKEPRFEKSFIFWENVFFGRFCCHDVSQKATKSVPKDKLLNALYSCLREYKFGMKTESWKITILNCVLIIQKVLDVGWKVIHRDEWG